MSRVLVFSLITSLVLLLNSITPLPVFAEARVKRATPTLKLATWNLEWLIAPAVLRPMRDACAPRNTPIRGNERRIPCDVAFRFDRSTSDFRGLARYAAQLDADVIALQEVDGPAAARLVFTQGYDFCFTSRPHVQNNGFAIRANVPHRCGRDLRSLSLNDSVRRGAEIILFPGEKRELRLLSVHLKSGCNRALLDTRNSACRDLARQAPALEAWIDEQARAGRRFAVLGDFNRDLLHDSGAARSADGRLQRFWPEIDDSDPPEARLVNAAQNQPFVSCTPGQRHSSYIDSIVLSRSLGAALVPGSFARVTYQVTDAHRLKLSDHCPVSVRIGP